MWICPNCNISLPNVIFPVNCRCGKVFHDITTDQALAVKKSAGKHKVSSWERDLRLAACHNCDCFHPAAVYRNKHTYERCDVIDLGCHGTYREQLDHTYGRCPYSRWPQPWVRWITTADLVQGAVELCSQLPLDIGAIIGIPRSGLIPAAVMATYLHLPLYTISPDNEIIPAGGGSRTGYGKLLPTGEYLLVDDTNHNGLTIEYLRQRIPWLCDIPLAVVYAKHPEKVDYYHQELPRPHLMEWNLFNASFISSLATDLDGIICKNPPHSHKPLFLPRNREVGTIITARPESQRAGTEEWCKQHRVKYSRLIMWPGDPQKRDLLSIARWKADMCSVVGAEFYIESEPLLADAIRKHNIRVLCPAQGFLA